MKIISFDFGIAVLYGSEIMNGLNDNQLIYTDGAAMNFFMHYSALGYSGKSFTDIPTCTMTTVSQLILLNILTWYNSGEEKHRKTMLL